MKKVLLLTIAAVSIITSCNEDLLDTKDPNHVTNDVFYTTLEQIGTSTNSIYAVSKPSRSPSQPRINMLITFISPVDFGQFIPSRSSAKTFEVNLQY